MNSFSAGGLQASDDLSGALNGKKPHARQAAMPWRIGTSREQRWRRGDRRTVGDVWRIRRGCCAILSHDDSPLDISRLRILEIGSGYFKYAVSGAAPPACGRGPSCRKISAASTASRHRTACWRELRAAGRGRLRRGDRQHHPLFALASALLGARAVQDAAPSLGVADPAIRRQHAALGQGAGAAGGDRHGRFVRHRQGFGVPARQGQGVLQARTAGRQMAGAVRHHPSASADAALSQQ